MRDLQFRAWCKNNDIGEFAMIGSDALCFSELDLLINHLRDKEDEIYLMQFTGFVDSNGKKIYEGDIIGDWVEVDGQKVQSKQQVFWNAHTGSWHLDNSFEQDKSCSTKLWIELDNFKYKILGNIYENPELIRNESEK